MELALKFQESENEESGTGKKHDVSFEKNLFLQEQRFFFFSGIRGYWFKYASICTWQAEK